MLELRFNKRLRREEKERQEREDKKKFYKLAF
jgi:hypothetical protein